MNVYHTQVGLDFTPRVVNNDAGKDGQRQVLIRQAEIAKQLNLPLYVFALPDLYFCANIMIFHIALHFVY